MPLANNLVFATFDNWRLPTALDQDGSGPWGGLNRTGSEMGHLYYTELGNSEGSLTNPGDFTNLRPGHYWSGTEYAPDSGGAWDFHFGYGLQLEYGKGADLYAMAVRPGHG